MPDAIVIISVQMKSVFQPIKKRHFSIRIMSANNENNCMNPNQKISERTQGKPFRGKRKNEQANNCRENFKEPRKQVVGFYKRPNKKCQKTYKKSAMEINGSGIHVHNLLFIKLSKPDISLPILYKRNIPESFPHFFFFVSRLFKNAPFIPKLHPAITEFSEITQG
jgi:hypothetical protein